MASQSSVTVARGQEVLQAAGTPEFLYRLAEELRARSGSDLPVSCFLEQIKLQLASGKSTEELQAAKEKAPANSNSAQYQSSDCFRSWAMPD
ncbi:MULTISPECIES: hypothetical protein [unclassified Sinorhizobium]|uniref:hypothetical protein n=1 Tax=unclassified Sinorhizobium TaxID=2613772 RepID=UPI0035250EA4